MKHTSWIRSVATSLLFSALATGAFAQTTINPPGSNARHAGERELTLGGAGVSNKDFDESLGGVSGSFGQYLNETQEVVLRQTINYANPDRGRQRWNGATRVAFDQHFAAHGAIRPFVGANFGGVYGDSVRDTWAAGIEGGAKLYVQPRTFVYAIVEYGWFFSRARAIDDRFSDGAFNWGVGIGFNF
jgi:hypothetical protein